jgi:preprotein translocase subunit SecG
VFGILLALLILDGILLSIVVLLQAGKGGGLAAMGGAGTDTFIGGRQAATILTKATWIGGAVFMTLALILSILSARAQRPQSILRDEFRQAAPAVPQPILPTAPQSEQQEQGGGASTAEPPAAGTPGEQPSGQQQ